MPTNAAGDHIQGHQVLAALGNDDVGVFLAGLHVHFVHGFNGFLVLLQHAFQGPAPLGHIPLDPAAKPHIRIGIHKNFNIHQIPQGLIFKNQNTLDDDDTLGHDFDGLIGTVVLGKIIHRALDALALPQQIQMAGHEIRFQRSGFIIIDLAALLVGQLIVTVVIVIMAEHRHHIAEPAYDVFHQGRFAAAGTSGNADDHYFFHGSASLFLFPAYNNTSFWMADTKDGGKVFEAFRSTPLAEADQAVKVGDYVEVKGNLVNYKGNTPETTQGGTYTILEAGETPEPETPTEPETPAEVVTIADGLALADNATCVLNQFTVIYVAGSYIYIEDESAYALLYQYNFGLKAGDKVTGLEVTKSTYQDIPQFKPVSTSLEGLTIVAGAAPAIDEITSAPTVADNHLVKLVNAKLAGTIVANATVVATCSDNTTINIYSKSDFAIEEGKAYNIIGGVTQYKGNIQIQAYEVEEYKAETTGVEDVIVNEKMTKVIKDGQMYIIRDGKAYNVLGAQL